MNTKELMIFTTVYEYGSVSKAAERLYMTQSSLSRVIQKIENDVGTELFRRTSDGLKPTSAGEIYRKSAEKMIELHRELLASISALGKGDKGRIILGTTFFMGAYVLPIIIPTFNRIFPNIEVKVIEGTSTEIENELVKGLIDVAIIHLPLLTQGLDYMVVASEHFMLAVPKDDPINQQAYHKSGEETPYLDLKLTAKKPYILTHPNQRARQECERICGLAGFSPRARLVTRNLQTAVRLCAEGYGYTLLPRSYASLYNQEQLPNFYNIDKEFKPNWDVAIIVSNKLPSSKAMDEFIEICKEVLPGAFPL